jgi:outer membrane lipoprotein carrier protein
MGHGKIMSRKLIVLALVVAACFGAIALPCSHAAEASNLSLNEILRKTESQYMKTQAFTAEFRQVTSSAAAGSAATEALGRLYYQKPRQMHWAYEYPETQMFVANQQLAWLYVPAEKQISLFDAKKFFASPLAQTFFDGMVELRNHFEVTLDAKRSTQDFAVLKLHPKKEDPNIKALQLTVDLRTYRITTIESEDALGNSNRITLQSQTTLEHVDSGLFQLTIPPSTVVVDPEGREIPPPEVEKLRHKLQPKQGT